MSTLTFLLTGQRDLPLANQRVNKSHDCLGVEHWKSQRGRGIRQEEGSGTKNFTNCSGTNWINVLIPNYVIAAVLYILYLLLIFFHFPGNLWSKPWVQSTAHWYHTYDSFERSPGRNESIRISCSVRLTSAHYSQLICVYSPWQNSWQKITTTHGDGRKSWSCSPKVIFFKE